MTEAAETSVQVALRIRPQIPREIIDMCRVCTKVMPGEPQVVIGDDKAFTYDYVFDTHATQREIYDTCVHKLVEGSLKGLNATVLAYGQTGSGKTYTMGTGFDVEIAENELGIIPRAIRNLFDGIEEIIDDAKNQNEPLPQFRIDAQFTEIYNEEIIDLFDSLNYNKKLIKIHEDIQGDINLTGAIQNPVLSVEDALEYLKIGALSRRTASTQMNSQSSRSHAIFTLLIRHQRLIKDDYSSDKKEYETLTSKFHFVDLAGSERLKRTGATGERAKEGISINCGLLALGNVISALAGRGKKSHVPYRDSKLTRLLQDSLGGNSQTLMIACVSPSDRDFMETLNTMKYANRAKEIKNKVIVNQDKSSRVISSLRQEIAQLQVELMEYKQGVRVLNSNGQEEYNDVYIENKMLQSELNSLRVKIKAMQETINVITNKNSELLISQVLWMKGNTSESDTNITEMIQGYLKEIEDLRVKLMESELTSESLRKELARHQSHQHQAQRNSSFKILDDNMTASVIECAKNELEQEKTRLIKHTNREEDDDNEKDDDDYDDSISSELAELSTNINMKQKLIEQLELSQKRIQTLKRHYENKLLQLQEKINDTQAERDKVLASFTTNSDSNDKAKKVRDTYEKKLSGMQTELRHLQAANREHSRLVRSQSQQENQLQALKNELTDMKRMKVKLMNQMKEESQRHKDLETRRIREIAQLQKESRKNAKLLQVVEADRRQKEQILKRKQEEVIALRKCQRQNSSPVSPSHLPKVFQNKWQNIESSIRKIVLSKQVVANEERDMNRFLARRKELSRTLGQLKKQKAHVEPTVEYNAEIESILDELTYIQEKITETQHNIVHYEECKDSPDITQLMQTHLKSMTSMNECRFILEKLLSMAVRQSIQAAQKESQLHEKESQMEQMREQYELHSRLLDSIVPTHLRELLSSQSSANEPGLSTSSSSDSTRAHSPVLLPSRLTNSFSYASPTVLTPARQKRYPKKRDDLLGVESGDAPKFLSLPII